MPEKAHRNPRWRDKFPLKTGYRWLDPLLLAVPVAVVFQYAFSAPPLLLFIIAAIGIIPLAGALGEATDELGHHLGERAGGLLNATVGNATE